ncbi:MAG: cytochrome c biogenesis protein CcdA [Peptostreptococcaceae bacterium]|nr:cytochrome c biogenesis protein CcdA [Peptostreptococcaceae bacterium]
MEYAALFLEGIITFISPCLLPMLPIYITYFIGDINEAEQNQAEHKMRALKNSIGFVIGFSIVFVSLGAAAATVGRFLTMYARQVNLVTGAIIVLFGLSYMGWIKLSFLHKSIRMENKVEPVQFGKAILFGMIFSIGWTPCVGTWLSTALLTAANSETVLQGSMMLLAYSLGLGIPFIVSALLLHKMMGAIAFIEKNYAVINKLAGIFLILMGVAIMSGYYERFLRLFL